MFTVKRFRPRIAVIAAFAVAAAAIGAAVAVPPDASALVALPSFVITPSSAPAGTTFAGDIEWYSGDPARPNHGCSQDGTYSVTDPSGLEIASGTLAANQVDEVTNIVTWSTFKFPTTAASPVGTYDVSGMCSGFLARGQFDVIASRQPALNLALSAPSALTDTGHAYSPNPFTVTAMLRNTGDGTVIGVSVSVNLTLPPGLHTTSPNPVTVGDIMATQQDVSWSVTADTVVTTASADYSISASSANGGSPQATGHVQLPGVGPPRAQVVFIAAMGSGEQYKSPTDLGPSATLKKV